MTRPASPSAEVAATCSFQVEIGADGKAPSAFKLLPFGDPFEARDGRSWRLVDRAHAEAVVARSRDWLAGADMMVDYDHQSALAATPGVGGRAPASGWVKGLEVRDDGIWAVDVEWTPAAEAALASREYRYISPWFYSAPGTRLVTRIRNAGLTNSPALDLPALAQTETGGAHPGEDPDMTKIYLAAASLASALARPAEGLDEATALAAIAELKQSRDNAQAALAAVAKDLGLGEDADGEAVLASVQAARTAGQPDPKLYVPKAGYDELAAKIARIEEDRVLASVDQAVAEGKLAPAMKQWAIDLGKKDEPALASFLASAVPVLGGQQVKGTPVPDKGKLTEEEAAICAQLGLDEAEYLKTRDTNEVETA